MSDFLLNLARRGAVGGEGAAGEEGAAGTTPLASPRRDATASLAVPETLPPQNPPRPLREFVTDAGAGMAKEAVGQSVEQEAERTSAPRLRYESRDGMSVEPAARVESLDIRPEAVRTPTSVETIAHQPARPVVARQPEARPAAPAPVSPAPGAAPGPAAESPARVPAPLPPPLPVTAPVDIRGQTPTIVPSGRSAVVEPAQARLPPAVTELLAPRAEPEIGPSPGRPTAPARTPRVSARATEAAPVPNRRPQPPAGSSNPPARPEPPASGAQPQPRRAPRAADAPVVALEAVAEPPAVAVRNSTATPMPVVATPDVPDQSFARAEPSASPKEEVAAPLPRPVPATTVPREAPALSRDAFALKGHGEIARPAEAPATITRREAEGPRSVAGPVALVAQPPAAPERPLFAQVNPPEIRVRIGSIEVRAAAPAPVPSPPPKPAAAPHGFDAYLRLRTYQDWER